jgi:hypothetical protein
MWTALHSFSQSDSPALFCDVSQFWYLWDLNYIQEKAQYNVMMTMQNKQCAVTEFLTAENIAPIDIH